MPPKGQLDCCDEINVKIITREERFFTYINQSITMEELNQEIRKICKFKSNQEFTLKWIDDEGDPCTISSDIELEEAKRLYKTNKDVEMFLHVFNNIPVPGQLCNGEDKKIYSRDAKRLVKLYKVNGHLLRPKRFKKKSYCHCCSDLIWGFCTTGLKCTVCNVKVHKHCHKDLCKPCCSDSVIQNTTHNVNTLPKTDASLPPNPVKQKLYSLDDFNIHSVIGKGSYAKVLMVELKKTKRMYAMKVIKKESLSVVFDMEWLQTEKNIFQLASNHPFLIGLHSCFQSPSRLFFVIELARGGDLLNHMQKQKKLPEFHVRFYAAEICLALHFLHNNGIIYRDLKLDNILLDHQGHIKLTDYGLCKEGITSTEGTITFCGTPNYIAPEILLGVEYGFSIDWWSLGVLLFEMLGGRSPFSCDDSDDQSEDRLFQMILEEPIRFPRFLSAKATSILRGLLQKDVADRLGCQDPEGFSDIVNHGFFKGIEWNLVESREVQPPYVPSLDSKRDVKHFPYEFTSERVKFSPEDPLLVQDINQDVFDGFDYVNPGQFL